jgi:hypothetical protein
VRAQVSRLLRDYKRRVQRGETTFTFAMDTEGPADAIVVADLFAPAVGAAAAAPSALLLGLDRLGSEDGLSLMTALLQQLRSRSPTLVVACIKLLFRLFRCACSPCARALHRRLCPTR